MNMFRGMSVDSLESMALSHYLTVYQLLKIGIPYETIMNMSDIEVGIILGVHSAIVERENELNQQAAKR